MRDEDNIILILFLVIFFIITFLSFTSLFFYNEKIWGHTKRLENGCLAYNIYTEMAQKEKSVYIECPVGFEAGK